MKCLVHLPLTEIILNMETKIKSLMKLCVGIDQDHTNFVPSIIFFNVLDTMKIRMPLNSITSTFS
jgi:hypothetical protein